MSPVLSFVAGVACGVLTVLGSLALLAAILIAWSGEAAKRWLNGIN